jgi:hypothetical protein
VRQITSVLAKSELFTCSGEAVRWQIFITDHRDQFLTEPSDAFAQHFAQSRHAHQRTYRGAIRARAGSRRRRKRPGATGIRRADRGGAGNSPGQLRPGVAAEFEVVTGDGQQGWVAAKPIACVAPYAECSP